MDTKKPKAFTAHKEMNESDRLWNEYWYIDPKQYSKAERAIIMVLKITLALLVFPLFCFAAISNLAPDDKNEHSSSPDPFLDAANGIDETQRFWLGKKENI